MQCQQLWSETLQGEHALLPRLSLKWSGMYARATFATPDQTDVSLVRATAANTQQGTFVATSSHLWQRSLDQDVAGYANLAYALRQNVELTAGAMLRHKNRRNAYDYYDLDAVTTGTGTNNRQVFTTYGQAQFRFNLDNGLEKRTDANNYTATERIGAGYAQAKVLLFGKLQVLGGVRLETTRQHYGSQLPPTQTGRSGTVSYLDWLPSVHAKYLLSEHQNLRLSYFKGISRPNLYELVPAVSSVNNDYYTESGNPYLKHARADNYDFRFEYFGPAASQLLAGVFYKRIANPIEYGFAQVNNNSSYYQPQNFGTATNFGAELVFTKYFRHWGLTGNYINNKNIYPLFFQNPQGVFDLEDSWVYGSTDDPIRLLGGRINVMRNTFEKSGKVGGECLNIKSGTTGNIAYNLFIGSATNGSKASNNGGKNPQTNIDMYNNTYIHCGFRRNAAGRGGSINYQEGSRGRYYNNLMVNCKYGPRVVGSGNYLGNVLVVADTASLRYGYSLSYADSLGLANEVYPTNFLTRPQATDLPLPGSFLPAGYKVGQVYNRLVAR